jgi:hypothetical protein
LYVADLGEEMTPGIVSKFDKDIKSKFHETSTFKDGKTMYFTRNNYLEVKGKNENKVTLLKYINPH